jgi:hypothetical protein
MLNGQLAAFGCVAGFNVLEYNQHVVALCTRFFDEGIGNAPGNLLFLRAVSARRPVDNDRWHRRYLLESVAIFYFINYNFSSYCFSEQLPYE